jgi:hypothetical protein
MGTRLLARLGLLAFGLGVALPVATRAAPPSVPWAFPVAPISVGTTTVELAFDTEGQATQLVVSAQGSGAAGSFLALSGAVVDRDYASAYPFHLGLTLTGPFPGDGTLDLQVTAIAPDGSRGPSTSHRIIAGASAPGFTGNHPISVRRDSSGGLLLEVNYAGQAMQAEASLVGVSSQSLRAVNGNLAQLGGAATFANERLLVARPRSSTPGKITFSIPTASRVPIDGVVIADVALVDPFGRRVHSSAVEFTDPEGFDTILALEVAPSPVLLAQGFGQREQLSVRAHFASAGYVDLTGAGRGVSYRSLDESVAAVTRDGQVVARTNGTTQIEASYNGTTATAEVIVDSAAQLSRIELGPPGATIPRVGKSVQLRLEGVLSTGTRVDLSPGLIGTTYSSSDPAAIVVSPDGRATSRRPGSALVTARHAGREATLLVDALDGPPEVKVLVPPTVQAGQNLLVQVDATDDVGVAKVIFLLNGVPAAEDAQAPFEIQLKAPPFSGGLMRIAARAVDTAGQETTSPEITVTVIDAPSAGNRPRWEAPRAGAMLVQGLPVLLQVTSGDGFSGSPDDYQAVRFTIDDLPVGTSSRARIEYRTKPQSLEDVAAGKQAETVAVPIWEVTYIPRTGIAGTGISIRAEAIGRTGLPVVSETLLVRIVTDAPPLISVTRPVGPTADATASIPFEVSGHIGDDAMGFGVEAALLVDGTTVARLRLSGSTVAGTPVGDRPFSFTWTPPNDLIGRMVKVEVQAIDTGGNERRVPIDVTIRSDQPPQVAVLTPQANASIPMGSRTLLTARVLDDGPAGCQVTWLVNGKVVGAAAAPPYSVEYLVPVAAQDESLVIEAVARDSVGHESRASISATGTLDRNPPTVSIVTPRDLADVTATQDLLVSVAGLDDVRVAKVEILFDDNVLFTDESPTTNNGVRGSFVTHVVVKAAQLASGGDHRIGARAWDSSGNIGRAPGVLVHTHDDRPPTVAFLTPTGGAEVTVGTSIEVLVQADDDVAVSSVELFGEQAAPIAVKRVPPYRFSVPASGSPRAYPLRAVAHDSSGQVAEAQLAIQIVADTRPPMVAFRAPTDGERVFAGRETIVTSVASDNVRVTSCTLTTPGATATLFRTYTDELYQVYEWKVAVPAGAAGSVLTLTARATDSAGLSATRALALQVVADRPPVVSLLTPAPGSPFKEGEDVRIAYTVTDDDGVIGVAGLSGGRSWSALPVTGTKIDTSGERVLTVWAPIISAGEPPMVGVVARDTAGQDGSSSVGLSIARDLEAPSALLAAPLPPSPPGSGPIQVREGGSLGMRVEVGDDVRVKRVGVMLRGGALTEIKQLDGSDVLSAKAERFDEVRTPNPLGPGQILLSRRYVGSFQGTASFKGIAPGRYHLYARAFDPAGNGTSTSEVEVEVVPFVDQSPPGVSLQLTGTPDQMRIVSGSTVRINVTARDDGVIDALTLRADNGPIDLGPIVPGSLVVKTVTWQAPTLAPGEDSRTVTLAASATDTAGHAGDASISRDLVADAAPTVSILEPTLGSRLTEERVISARARFEDDVGVRASMMLFSTSDVTFGDGPTARVAAPGATAGAPGGRVTFKVWNTQSYALAGLDGAVSITTPADALGSPGMLEVPGRLTVEVPGVTGSLTARYRYRVRPGHENDASVLDFQRSVPGGRRTVSLAGPTSEADLSYPDAGVQVEQVLVELPSGSGISDAGVALLDPTGRPALQLRAHAFGQAIAVQRPSIWPAGTPGPGTATERLRVPQDWGSSEARLTVVVVDTSGAVAMHTTNHPVDPDRTPPVFTAPQALSLAKAGPVVEGATFEVIARYSDDVVVETVELLADGARKGSEVPPLGAISSRFKLSLPLSGAAPVALTALAQDRVGNASITDPVYVTVVADEPPVVTFESVTSAVERIGSTELASGITRILQATPATVAFRVTDDVGVAHVVVEYEGLPVQDQQYPAPSSPQPGSVQIVPPVRADGSPTVLVVTAWDTRGQRVSARLILETRHPEAPSLAVAAPGHGETIAEGSIQLSMLAVAGDDTGIAGVEFFVNGQRAVSLAGHEGKGIPVLPDALDAAGLPVALDAAIRLAVEAATIAAPPTLKAPFDDVTRLRQYTATLALPPGFVALDPSRTRTSLAVRAVATDLEGNQTVVDRELEVVRDLAAPQVQFLKPPLGRDVVEGTPVRVELVAFDNVLVDRVEILAGRSEQALQVVQVRGGFPSRNALPGSPGAVYAPIITYDLTVPRLADLGAVDTSPYFIAARARDISGNWTTPSVVQYVDVVRDRGPACAIISPSEYGRAVESTYLPVTVAAEDDVAIASVDLWVDGLPLGPLLRDPPFFFQVPVPVATPGRMLHLRARALDSFGHEVWSNIVQLPVVSDTPPTVAIAEPRNLDILTEGREFAFVVAAQDDAGIASVEAAVDGGLGGPLRFFASERPYSFRIPLPNGSAGRTLTLTARARDTRQPGGQVTAAVPVTVTVKRDDSPPTVQFLAPAPESEIPEGQSLAVEVRADDNVGVASVAFDLGGTVVATMPSPPFRFVYPVARGSAGRRLTFTAKATDLSGLTSSSSLSVNVIADQKPGVTLFPPAHLVAGIPARIDAEAWDDLAVARVDFDVGLDASNPAAIERRLMLPYRVLYTPPKEWVGRVVALRARATDTSGQETASATALRTIEADQPPSIRIVKPAQGSMVFDGGVVRIEAEAVDVDGGVKSVAFLVDDRRVDISFVAAGIPGAPGIYRGTFYTPVGGGNRTFTLKAVATDSADQETVSAPVVIGTVKDTVPPEVELVDPLDGDLLTLGDDFLLSAAATDNAPPVARVEFQVDGQTVGSTAVTVNGPANRPLHRYPWVPGAAQGGRPARMAGEQQTIQALAVDRSNNSGSSAAVTIELGMRPKARMWVPNSPKSPVGPLAAREDGLLILGTPEPQSSREPWSTLRVGRALEDGTEGISRVDLDGPGVSASFHGDLALVTTRDSFIDRRLGGPLLSVFSVANAVVPLRRGAIELLGPDVGGVAARDRLAFVANGESGVVVVDLTDPSQPVRLTSFPVVGSARDVAVAGDLLLVAAGTGGLRIVDLKDPELKELGFVAVPGGATSVAAQGGRAYVGCSGGGAQLAVIDISRGDAPSILSLGSTAPRRRDLRADGLVDVAVAGRTVVTSTSVVDQEQLPVKGLLTVSALNAGATVARPLVRANLTSASQVAVVAGGVVAFDPGTPYQGAQVRAYALPRLVVTGISPPDGAEGVGLQEPELAITVELSASATPVSAAASVVLRAQDPVIGPQVAATVEVADRRLYVHPSAKLDVGKTYYVTVGTGLETAALLPLDQPLVTRFRTRQADAPLPVVSDVVPSGGPADGGTVVLISGIYLQDRARVFFSGREATEVHLLADGRLSAKTPAGVLGPALVTVLNPDGLQGSLLGGFTYLDLLQAYFCLPASGKLAGGDLVELSGAGYQRGATVTVGGAAGVEPRVLSPGHLQFYTPPGLFGPADVVVTNPDGRRAVAPAAFFYSELQVTSVVGRHVPLLDGTDQRPAFRLPQTTPGAVSLSGGVAWVLSKATVNTSATTPAELLSKSLFGAVSFVDVHDPANASVMGAVSVPPPYEPVGLTVRGNLGYVVVNGAKLDKLDVVGEGGPALLVVDGAEKTAGTIVATVPFQGTAETVAVADDLLIASAGPRGVALFSIANPRQPVLLGYQDRFLVNGTSQLLDVKQVATQGQLALLSTAGTYGDGVAVVVDLAQPGLRSIATLPQAFLSVGGSGRRLLAAKSWLRSLSLANPAAPEYVADLHPLLAASSMGGFSYASAGAQFGVGGWGGGDLAYLQFVALAEPGNHRPVDAVGLFPAKSLGGVALERDVAVASITDAGKANDAFAVVPLPFPLVVAVDPPDGADGVPVASPVRVEMSRAVLDADAGSVRLLRVDGSSNGAQVGATVATAGNSITLVPIAPLATSATYRLVMDGLHEDRSGSAGAPMPAAFTAEFATASSASALSVSLSGLAPQQGKAGTQVTITGAGFGTDPAHLSVRFASQPARLVELDPSGTRLVVEAPPNPAGAAGVEVSTGSGTRAFRAGAFVYRDPLTVASVTPNRGPTSGTTRVSIAGTGFSPVGAVQVYFGDVLADDIRVMGVGLIQAIAPNGLVGPTAVRVVNPDAESFTLSNAYTYDRPTMAAVAYAGRIYDAVVIDGRAYLAAGAAGLQVLDLSGTYTRNPKVGPPLKGLYIPPDLRDDLVDVDGDHVDDRIIGQLPVGGEAVSISYPLEGGDRIYLGVRTRREVSKNVWIVEGAISEVNVSSPEAPRITGGASAAGSVFGIDARHDRLLVGAGIDGLRTWDISPTPAHAPFPLGRLETPPAAQALAVEGSLCALGVGGRDEQVGGSDKVAGGVLQLLDVAGAPAPRGALSLEVQKVRLRGGYAFVAAGDRGLVIVDAHDPARPVELARLGVGGFAWDLALSGDIAYVAAGPAGVAVVDISDPLAPRLKHFVTGARGGDARAVTMAWGQLVSLRDHGAGGWSFDFGYPVDFAVETASVHPGELVPLDLPSVTVVLSTTLDPATAPGAFSLTADGSPVPGTLEAGVPGALVSTLVFRPSVPFPPNADLRLDLRTSLRSDSGHPLAAPFQVRFRSAGQEGVRPQVAQVVPRVGLSSGGEITWILGDGFDVLAQVRIGGRRATVLAASSTQLAVTVPPGDPGLADVEVENPGGLMDRRVGGYFYSAPLQAGVATPRFLNPKGRSTVRVTGSGFLPDWADALGSTRVLVRGLPVFGVSVESTTSLTALAPPGTFGLAEVSLVAPDGISRSTSASTVGYGLPFSGEEKAVAVRPRALTQDPETPLLIYAAPGAHASGNRFLQPFVGTYLGASTIPESFRVVAYDVTLPGRPRASLGQIVDAIDASADIWAATSAGTINTGTTDAVPLPDDLEVEPDALDVAIGGANLYVANGTSGLTILNAGRHVDPAAPVLEDLPVLSHEPRSEEVLSARVSPTATGALVTRLTGMVPEQECPPTGGTVPAHSTGAWLDLVDARNPRDPVLLARFSPAKPYAATISGGRLLTTTASFGGIKYCPAGGTWEPVPNYSLTRVLPDQGPGGLTIYDGYGPGAKVMSVFPTSGPATDVVVVQDVAILAVGGSGLIFVDLSNAAAPTELPVRIRFDQTLSNHPGVPLRLRLVGDLLFVACEGGGPLLVDVSDPRHPELVSGGNRENALDVLPVRDRLLLAGHEALTELELPFTYVTGTAPERGSLVPPEVATLQVRFSRPIAPATANDSSVHLLANGAVVPVDLAITADPQSLLYALTVTPRQRLDPATSYELLIDRTLADQRGGSLLIPFRFPFRTAAAGSRSPRISAVTPYTARAMPAQGTASGSALVVTGTGLGGASRVLVGGVEANFTVASDSRLEVTAPLLAAGPVDLVVEDAGGPTHRLPMAVLYLDDLAVPRYAISPPHGPVAGKSRITVSAGSGSPVGPGTQVVIRDALGAIQAGVDVDVVDLHSLRFTMPAANEPGLASVELVRPDGQSTVAGTFSYDLPVGTKIDLPGFPPRVASEIKQVGDLAYVGTPTLGTAGLEIFDISIEEHPIWVGSLRTDAPVRGFDVAGNLALLAAEGTGLVLADVTDKARPYVVGQVITDGRATGVRVEGTLAYVSTTDPGPGPGHIQVLDVGSASLPPQLSVTLQSDALALDLGPGRFYALTSDVNAEVGNGVWLSVYSRTGTLIGRAAVDETVRAWNDLVSSRLTVRFGRAYVTSGSRLYVFDLSDEANPLKVQSTVLDGRATGLTWMGGTLYVATTGKSTLVAVPPVKLLAVDVTPAPGSHADPGAMVRVTFNLPVIPGSVDETTFSITADRGDGSGPLPVPGTRSVTFDVHGSSVAFTPSAPWPVGATVAVDVAGVKGFDTRPLAVPVHTTFLVADGLQPSILAIEPATGYVDALTPATIRGSGFRAGDVVLVGGSEATVVAVSAAGDRLDIVVPHSAAPGLVAVEILDPGGLTARRLGAFLYRDHLRLLLLSPDRAAQAGGVKVALRGYGFRPGMAVNFGGTDSFDVQVTSAELAVAVAPAHAGGYVDVTARLAKPAVVASSLPSDFETATLTRSFLYGAGAVSRLDTMPVADLLVDKGVAYAALGATVDIQDSAGNVLRAGVSTPEAGLLVADVADSNHVTVLRTLKFPAVGGARRVVKVGMWSTWPPARRA